MSDLWKKYKKYMAAAGISIIVLLALTAFYVRYDYQQYCKEAVPILEYHGIGSADGWMKELFVSKETFETHLQYLHDNGYKMVSVKKMALSPSISGHITSSRSYNIFSSFSLFNAL